MWNRIAEVEPSARPSCSFITWNRVSTADSGTVKPLIVLGGDTVVDAGPVLLPALDHRGPEVVVHPLPCSRDNCHDYLSFTVRLMAAASCALLGWVARSSSRENGSTAPSGRVTRTGGAASRTSSVIVAITSPAMPHVRLASSITTSRPVRRTDSASPAQSNG